MLTDVLCCVKSAAMLDTHAPNPHKRGSFLCGSSDWRLLLQQLGEKLGQGRCHADINNSVGMVRAGWGCGQ